MDLLADDEDCATDTRFIDMLATSQLLRKHMYRAKLLDNELTLMNALGVMMTHWLVWPNILTGDIVCDSQVTLKMKHININALYAIV
jgi:hypothetical protein